MLTTIMKDKAIDANDPAARFKTAAATLRGLGFVDAQAHKYGVLFNAREARLLVDVLKGRMSLDTAKAIGASTDGARTARADSFAPLLAKEAPMPRRVDPEQELVKAFDAWSTVEEEADDEERLAFDRLVDAVDKFRAAPRDET